MRSDSKISRDRAEISGFSPPQQILQRGCGTMPVGTRTVNTSYESERYSVFTFSFIPTPFLLFLSLYRVINPEVNYVAQRLLFHNKSFI